MTKLKNYRRDRIKKRIRKIISGSLEYPRLSVFRSNKEIYCQLIDDNEGKTLISVSSRDKKILKCDAIPKVSLSQEYISKFSEGWNKWNGLELNDQIKDGVESLVKNCYQEGDKKSEELKNNYCDFAKGVKVLQDSILFQELC